MCARDWYVRQGLVCALALRTGGEGDQQARAVCCCCSVHEGGGVMYKGFVGGRSDACKSGGACIGASMCVCVCA